MVAGKKQEGGFHRRYSMNKTGEAVMFLLKEYMDVKGDKYVRYVNEIGELDEDDPLRPVLQEELDRVREKLAKAKVYIQSLKICGVHS